MSFSYFWVFFLRKKKKKHLLLEAPSVLVPPWQELEMFELHLSSSYKKCYQQKGEYTGYHTIVSVSLTLTDFFPGALRQDLLNKLPVRQG